jgi:uncharacterized membrane protein YqjE
MSSEAARPAGIVSAAGTFVESALELAKSRFQLFGVELQEEKYRLVQMVIWLAAAGFSAVMALTFVSITVVYAFWETARLEVLIGLTIFYVGAFAIILWQFRRFLADQPRPFSATLAEFEKDTECIRPKN